MLVTAAMAAACQQSNSPTASPSPSSIVVPAAAEQPSSSEPGSLRTGRPIEALGFTVPPRALGADPVVSAPTESIVKPSAATATEAVSSLIDSVIAGEFETTFSLLTPNEQRRAGSSQRLAAELGPLGWKSYAVTATAAGSVTAEIVQSPRVSDIDGVISPTATVIVPVVADASGFTLTWSRRVVMAHHPERSAQSDTEVSQAAIQWAQAAQQCSAAPLEYFGGLIGVTGLADQLCRATGTPTVESVGDLDSLDEPQPVIDGFGSSSATWARIVHLTAPVAMNVVLAPDGDRWMVIAIACPSLAATATTAATPATPPPS